MKDSNEDKALEAYADGVRHSLEARMEDLITELNHSRSTVDSLGELLDEQRALNEKYYYALYQVSMGEGNDRLLASKALGLKPLRVYVRLSLSTLLDAEADDTKYEEARSSIKASLDKLVSIGTISIEELRLSVLGGDGSWYEV